MLEQDSINLWINGYMRMHCQAIPYDKRIEIAKALTDYVILVCNQQQESFKQDHGQQGS